MEEKKTGKHFVKGHPNYHKGKKVKQQLFYEVSVKYASGEYTQADCGKAWGVSTNTASKWLHALFENNARIDENLTFVEFED